MIAVLVLAVTAGACSAPATLGDLRDAEQRADRGDIAGALAAYRAAQTTCVRVRPAARRAAACSDALLGEAELLERSGRPREAITAYLAITQHGELPAAASTASYRAGELLLRARDTTAAWTALWRTITDWPDEAHATDALRTLVSEGRRRDPRALADHIASILTPLVDSEVADNLVWALADLTEHELANPSGARALYDRIPLEYPTSGLRDDARWHGARLSRAIGDPRGAVARLRGLLATREVALGAGSYFSIWLDDAQLELAKVLRDELADPTGAIAALRELPKLFPASVLKDDALYELAVTFAAIGSHADACRAVAELVATAPDSKYVARGKELCR